MAKIEGVSQVIAALNVRQRRAVQDGKASVIVGYTQAYAIYVHENRNARHHVGRAGFLLDIAREMANDLRTTVSQALAAGRTLLQSLLLAGLRLQRESQKNCPVLTGALKGSAFTREV